MSSREEVHDEEINDEATTSWLTLATVFRVVAVLCLVMGAYLCLEAVQYVSVAGQGAYITAALRLGIAVVVALSLLLGEKVCRYLDGE